MVAIKVGTILIFLVVGGMLVNPANWKPFAPSGFGGIITGGAVVFFTYIGFDSVSAAAEETKNPQHDLPIGIIGSLIICRVLYIGVSIVLLGMMRYQTFVSGTAAEAPVAYALQHLQTTAYSRAVVLFTVLQRVTRNATAAAGSRGVQHRHPNLTTKQSSGQLVEFCLPVRLIVTAGS